MTMTSKRVLHIEVTSAEESLGQFAATWERAVRDKAVKPYHGVGFESMGQLLATLTPKRWELIERLRCEGPMTIYALAKLLGRDYKNVHRDVKALMELDIIQETDGKIEVPWDEIEARLRIAA
jgi:predicted transcriptional regulator